ncbi:MAG: hypothetical protein IJY14_04380 [Acholeplasmatales bacterium]|nr:hypothetical protein [Acholeplasmatales bacterium]
MEIVYEINGGTLIVRRTINYKRIEEIKNGIFEHFMNKALEQLEENDNDDRDRELTEQT